MRVLRLMEAFRQCSTDFWLLQEGQPTNCIQFLYQFYPFDSKLKLLKHAHFDLKLWNQSPSKRTNFTPPCSLELWWWPAPPWWFGPWQYDSHILGTAESAIAMAHPRRYPRSSCHRWFSVASVSEHMSLPPVLVFLVSLRLRLWVLCQFYSFQSVYPPILSWFQDVQQHPLQAPLSSGFQDFFRTQHHLATTVHRTSHALSSSKRANSSEIRGCQFEHGVCWLFDSGSSWHSMISTMSWCPSAIDRFKCESFSHWREWYKIYAN